MTVQKIVPAKRDPIQPYSRVIQLPKRPLSEDGKRVSKEVYWKEYYEHPDFVYEWNDGVLEVKPMSTISKSQMYRWKFELMSNFLRVNPIATMTALEIGFDLALGGVNRVRIPDLGVVRHDNSIAALPEDHRYKGIYDLCIESLSDSHPREIKRDVEAKRFEYAKVGVKEYYILDDVRDRHMSFFYLTSSGDYQEIPPTSDGVIRSLVLPGFQFRIEDLYNQTPLDELVDDPVYQQFIWPEYLEEKRRADSEKDRADSEKKRADKAALLIKNEKERADGAEERARIEKERADQAEQQAELARKEAEAVQQLREQTEKYIAKLRELGIDPDSLST